MKKFLKIFGFRTEAHSLQTELFSGFSTFIVMAYILALAPSAFTGIGGKDNPFPVESLFSSIAIVSALSCVIMAVWAKRPLCVAPGVGLLFFVTGTICTTMGYSWQFALTATFLEGLLFILLSFSGLRNFVVETIPLSLRSAIGVGVSFFLASLGLKNAGMLDSGSAILSLASMVTEPSKQLLAISVILAGVLIIARVRGAIFITIIISTLIGIPMGLTHFDTLIKMPENPAPLFCQMEWSEDVFSVDMLVCVISILFLDVFDTIGTTTCTSYLESAAGVAEGGRTGVTPMVAAVCFLLALLFSPVFLAIPASVTGAILLIVSVKMFTAVRHINFHNPVESIPSVLTILVMAIVGSISDGIVVGVLTYAIFYFVYDMMKQRERRKSGSVFKLD